MTVEDPTNKQIEEVDPEVAEILGLEENFDLEQDEYMTLLKERIAKGAFDENAKLSEDDLAKLANERKRIRDLKGSKFTNAKKAVNVDSFFGRNKEESSATQKPITDAAKLLPGSGGAIQKYKPPEEEPQEEKKDDTSDKLKEVENFLSGTLLGIVKEIRGLTEDILSVLQKQNAADKKGSELSRRESEKGGKKGKEKDLEKKEEKKGLGLVEKIAKPFTSIFDTIKNFILMVLLGSAVNFLWTVFKNPMILLKPIQGLIDGITGFFNTVIQFIDKMVVQPVRNFIDSINTALNGFIGLLNNALKMLPGSPQIGPANIPNIPQAPEIQAPNITGEKKEPPAKPQPQPKVQLNFTGGPIERTRPVLALNNAGPVSPVREKKNPFDDIASKEGGIVNSKTTAFDVSGLGPDKFLTALSLGEYILKPGAVSWLGGETYLNSVNKLFGGSEQRRTANLGDIKIESKSTGGPIGPSSSATPASSNPTSGSSTPASTSKSVNPDGSFKVNNKIFSPTNYVKDTRDTKYIKIGTNPPKSYVLKYQRQGASGNITVKQVNKLVSGAGATVLFGNKDNLTGVLPSSPEGRLVINSANLVNYFRTAQNHAVAKSIPLNIKYDNDSDIYYWYNQAYQTHYNDWMKKGVGQKTASNYAAYAAAEFAISKSSKGSKGSWVPGSKLGAPEALKTQAVEADLANPDSTSPSSDDTSTSKPVLSASDLSFSIKGDAAKQSYINNLSKTNNSSTPSPSAQPITPLVQGSQPKAKEKDPVGPAPAKPAAPASSPAAPASSPAAPASSGTSGVTLDQYGRDPTKLPSKEQREAAANARQQALAMGFLRGSPQYEKMVAEATMKSSSAAPSPATLSPANISSTPKPIIPEPPQSKPSITTLPLPQLEKQGSLNKGGMTKTGSTPIIHFSSSNGSESSIVTTASLYNIWGM